MLERIKYATISDIYTKKLDFFSPENKDNLIEKCKKNNYTFLPGEDRVSCYKLVDDDLVEEKLSEDLICRPYDLIFDDQIIEKFENSEHDSVLFSVEGNKIKGLVHIVDYNTEFINYEFYKIMYQFEVQLRQLLIDCGETNDSLIEWMKIQSETSTHWKNRYRQCMPKDDFKKGKVVEKRNNFSPFHTFYISDLLEFISDKNYLSNEFNESIYAIKKIRNWIAHNQDLAQKSIIEESSLYRVDELKEFVKNARLFFNCYEELEDKLQ